jgi:hypothetical protein
MKGPASRRSLELTERRPRPQTSDEKCIPERHLDPQENQLFHPSPGWIHREIPENPSLRVLD